MLAGSDYLLNTNKISQIWHALIKHFLKKLGTLKLSLQFRLFMFLVLQVLLLVLASLFILHLTGFNQAGYNNEIIVAHKLNYTAQNISSQYRQISAEAVQLSKDLSLSLENKLREQGMNVTEMVQQPELIEELLTEEYERTLLYMQNTQSTGAFIFLDGAGLYLKREKLSQTNLASLKTQFDVSEAWFFEAPLRQARQHDLALDQLYYWSKPLTLPGTTEKVMLCSVPLIDSEGNAFGVSGFEVSADYFTQEYALNRDIFPGIFCLFGLLKDNPLQSSAAMYSGQYSGLSKDGGDLAFHIVEENEKANPSNKKLTFNRYVEENGGDYLGFHTQVELYPPESPFINDNWALAVMVPEGDVRSVISDHSFRLILMFGFLALFGITLSYGLSKCYIKPIACGLDLIRAHNFNRQSPKTRITEIDDLLDYLSKQRESQSRQYKQEELPSEVLNIFLSNIKTLTPAERNVFNLYLQDYTAKEIAGILCLSINTIKTHTKRIYSKLNIFSRRELLLYMDMLREAGKEIN